MFKKLKHKFILTNILTSTLVLVVAFSAIYFTATFTAEHRAPVHFEQKSASGETVPENENPFKEFNDFLDEKINAERNFAKDNLLVSLVVSGVSIELVIAFLSFYLAEQAVKPVREAYEAQKSFVANASHEIKTPLAVIQANLEAADIQGNEWLDNVGRKVEDLAELNNQLLALARTDAISETPKLTEFNLEKLVDTSISEFEPKAEKQGKTITKSSCIKENPKIKANKSALKQILDIYIDNGIKYGKNTVSINIKKDRIAVISDGKPIPEEKLPHLFDRFYQADKTEGGVGLGLAIAKSVADKNGWKVYATVDKDYKTNIFTLEFK